MNERVLPAAEWRPCGEGRLSENERERETFVWILMTDIWYSFVENITLQKVFHHLSSLPTVLPLQSLFHTLPALISLFSLIFFSLLRQIWNVWQILFRLLCRCACVFQASVQIRLVTNREPKAKISEARHLKHYSFIIPGFLSEMTNRHVRCASHDHLNGYSLAVISSHQTVLIPFAWKPNVHTGFFSESLRNLYPHDQQWKRHFLIFFFFKVSFQKFLFSLFLFFSVAVMLYSN